MIGIARLYFSRWKIEKYFRYKKQVFQFENFWVQKLKACLLYTSGTVYNDKEGQAKAMAKMVEAIGTDEEIAEKYVYLPYIKVTSENIGEFLEK